MKIDGRSDSTLCEGECGRIESLKSAKAVPLWLLQRDDTPFLCLSFLASVLLHGALFIVLAATRIFQPFTGDSGQFELVWFSLSASESQQPVAPQKAEVGGKVEAPSGRGGMESSRKVKHAAAGRPRALPPPLLPAASKQPHPTAPAPVPTGMRKALPQELPAQGADAEMVISRFGGKVVEIVDKDSEIPVYRTFSTAQKSPNPMAMVQYLPETGGNALEKHTSLKTVESPVPKPIDTKAATSGTVPIAKPGAAPAVAVAAPVQKMPAAAEQPVPEKKTVAEKRTDPPVPAPQPAVTVEVKKSPASPEPAPEKAGNVTITRTVKEFQPSTSEKGAMAVTKIVVKEQTVQLRQSSSVVKRVAETRTPVREPAAVAPAPRRVATAAAPLPKVAAEEKRPSSPVPAPVPSLLHPSPPPVRTVEIPRERTAPAAPKIALRVDTSHHPKPEPAPVRAPGRIQPKAEPLPVRPLPTMETKEKPPAVPISPVIESKRPAAAVSVSPVKEKTTEPAPGKPSPASPEKPRAILMPPLAGDLKIVITGEEDIKVEAVFREFRKVRRNRPMNRGEARNSRGVPLKRARTKLNVHEAAIEIAEEGVYDLTVRSANGRPVTAAFVIKIHEKGSGAISRNLGRRTLRDGALLARILMPDGIFWDDESSFTGTMEDSDSITRFNTETGLVWREFQ